MSWFKGNPEVKVGCPYDRCHIVYIHKLSTHLEKCRRNYTLKQIAKGEKALHLVCKYNSIHRVLLPEILYHESRCLDRRKRIPVDELLDLAATAAQSGKIKQVEVMDEIFEEQSILWRDGIYLDQQPNKLMPFMATTESTPCTSDQARFSHLFEKLREAKIEGGQDQSLVGPSSLVAQGMGGSQDLVDSGNREDQVEEDDDEDWGKGSESRPSFDYMDLFRNPKRPLRNMFPPGLSKPQRREWARRNTEWIHRIAKEEEEERKRIEAEEGN